MSNGLIIFDIRDIGHKDNVPPAVDSAQKRLEREQRELNYFLSHVDLSERAKFSELLGAWKDNETQLTREIDDILEKVFVDGMIYSSKPESLIVKEAKEILKKRRIAIQKAMLRCVYRARPLIQGETDPWLWFSTAVDEYLSNLNVEIKGQPK